ncbi:MAG: DUF2807 domain-containing protein [Pseudomonadota bacterium]
MSIDVRQISRFDRIHLHGPGAVLIRQSGHPPSVTVHAPSYLMSSIESRVVDGCLSLGYRSGVVVPLSAWREVVSCEVSVQDLHKLTLTGTAAVTIPDLDTDSLVLRLSGRGKIRIDRLTSDRLETWIGRGSRVAISGDVELQSVNVEKDGHYDTGNLVSDIGVVNVSGGTAQVMVNDDLSVNIADQGRVVYSGFPEVNKQISTGGQLVRMRTRRRQQSSEDMNA